MSNKPDSGWFKPKLLHVAEVYTATVWFVLDWYTVHVAEVYTARVWFVLDWYTVHVAEDYTATVWFVFDILCM